MNLNQLEYFIAAAEALNFTRAAKQCFISQTAMTQQIRSLEETVGTALFLRDKHHVELTTAGRIYYKEAKAIIKRNNEALRLVRNASSEMSGHLHIGFIRGFGSYELTELLRKFRNAYPNVQLSFTRDNASPLRTRLDQGDCDLIIANATSHTDSVLHRHLLSFPLMAVLSPEHPLGDKPYLTYPDLEGEPFILMQPNARAKDEMEESLLIYERGGYLPNIVSLQRDPETLMLMISLGMGISILPEFIVRPYQGGGDLKILPVVKADGSAETYDLDISWSPRNQNPAIDDFLACL